jgi:putative MATE family efflux protein
MGLVQQLVSLSDRYFLGHLGEVALGSHGLSAIWFFMFLVIGMGLGTGVQTVVARRLGESNLKEAGRSLDQGLVQSLLLGLGAMAVMLLCTKPVMQAMMTSERVAQAGVEYLVPRMFELPFAFVFLAIRGFYSGVGYTMIMFTTAVVQGVVNIVLNQVLIYGELGIAPMGIAGAGWGSFGAQVAALVAILLDIFLRRFHTKYHLFKQFKWDGVLQHKLIVLSAPSMLQFFMSLFSFYVFLWVIEGFGERPLALTSMTFGVYVIFMCPTWGFGVAATTLVSQLMGKGQPNRVWLGIGQVLLQSVLCIAPCALGFFFLDELIYSQFTTDISLAQEATLTTPVLMVALGLYALSGVMVHSLFGLGATRQAMAIEVAAITAFLVFCFVSAQFTQDLRVIWVSEVLYVGTICLGSYLYLRTGRWRKIVV